MMLNLNILDRVGDWNPQLFRELKGRLKPRNVAIAIVLSLLGQGFLLLFCSVLLPNMQAYKNFINPDQYTNAFCTGYYCSIDPLTKGLVINWTIWWLHIFRILNWTLPCLLVMGGALLLAQDMMKEERRGTLNFIRMSPQSAQNILIGKLLGVPALVYLIVLVTLPLHIWSAIQAQASSTFIVSFYMFVSIGSSIFYILTLLIASLGGKTKGMANALLVLIPLGLVFAPLYILWHLLTSWNNFSTYLSTYDLWEDRPELYYLQWFSLSVSQNIWGSHGFNLVNLVLIAKWLWGSVVRRFNEPNSTIATKKQSYLIVFYLEILFLGFCVLPQYGSGLIPLYISNLVYFLVLIAALSPHRQTLLDWARYCHISSRERRKGFIFNPAIIRELICSEESPAPVAVLLNLAVATLISDLGIIFLHPGILDQTKQLLSFSIFASLIAIYAVVTQILLMMRTDQRSTWAGFTLCALIILPPSIFGLLSLQPSQNPFLWLFSSFPWAGVEFATVTEILMALSIQLIVLTFLSLHLKRKLQKAGESEFKALLRSQSS